MSYTTLSLKPDAWTKVRTKAGVIAADSATLTDANIAPALALNCKGFDTIFVRPVIAGGVSPSVIIEPLFYDALAADGARWQRIILDPTPGVVPAGVEAIPTTCALGNGQVEEVAVYGFSKVYLRVTDVNNPGSTTSLILMAYPGKRSERWMKGV